MVDLCTEKGRRLRQASAQHTYNRTLEDAKLKLEEFEKNLQSTRVGNDLRHCKQLLKQHQVCEEWVVPRYVCTYTKTRTKFNTKRIPTIYVALPRHEEAKKVNEQVTIVWDFNILLLRR